jgi:signal transduction histidine kinase
MRLVSDTAPSVRPIFPPGGRSLPALPFSHAFRPRIAPATERALHAALVLPFTEGLAQATSALLGLGRDQALAAGAANQLGGTAFAAGMSIPELSHHLERARRQALAGGSDAAACELDGRACLLRALLSHQGGTLLHGLCAGGDAGQQGRFGHWLTRLQAAWYAGQDAAALEAVHAGSALAGPLTATGDLLLFHVFALLALARWDRSAAPALERHCNAARRLDARCRASLGAIDALAQAARDAGRGDAIGALRGFERAAAGAGERGLHWLAALACEQAAQHALEAGLASATRHYRQQSLACCRRWGALGRLAALQDAWRDVSSAAAGAATDAQPAADCADGLGLAIAHELNQPLAAIGLHAAAAGKWLERAEPDIGRALDSLALIGAAGRQAGEIVRGMQRLAAARQNETAGVDLDGAVRETLFLLQRRLRQHRIEVDLVPGLAGCAIEANRVQLQQVLTNLVVNAIEAIEANAGGAESGTRRIRVETRRDGQEAIELAVSDNGPGVAPADRERIFASHFSTKPRAAGAAAGMGLSISLSIARAHGGHLWFEPCEPHGACFRLRLPLLLQPVPAAPAPGMKTGSGVPFTA